MDKKTFESSDNWLIWTDLKSEGNHSTITGTISEMIEKKLLRVKYTDKEDIESLEFLYISRNQLLDWAKYSKQTINDYILNLYINNTGIILLEKKYEDFDPDVLFKGFIKKKILTQIKIF